MDPKNQQAENTSADEKQSSWNLKEEVDDIVVNLGSFLNSTDVVSASRCVQQQPAPRGEEGSDGDHQSVTQREAQVPAAVAGVERVPAADQVSEVHQHDCSDSCQDAA